MVEEELIDEEFPTHLPVLMEHSMYKENILCYIGGYICRKLSKKMTCETCVGALFCNERREDTIYQLTNKKDNGGLVYPSTDVVKIISVTESVCKEYLDSGIDSTLSKSKIKNRVMKHLRHIPIFFPLLSHDIDFHDPFEDLHSTQISKAIIEEFLNLRLLRYGQEYATKMNKKDIGLLILFKGLWINWAP